MLQSCLKLCLHSIFAVFFFRHRGGGWERVIFSQNFGRLLHNKGQAFCRARMEMHPKVDIQSTSQNAVSLLSAIFKAPEVGHNRARIWPLAHSNANRKDKETNKTLPMRRLQKHRMHGSAISR